MVEKGLVGEGGGERYSRDLLQRFRLCDGIAAEKLPYKSPNDEAEELELGLGLSLGGRFGTEKSSKRLARSSSVTDSIPFMWEEKLGSTDGQSASSLSIFRTCSLPTEAEEELRKRKEWQSLQRMEGKRRQCERQRKGGDKDNGDEIMGQATINFVDMHDVFGNGKAPGVGMSLPSVGLQGSAAITAGGLFGDSGVVDLGSKGKEGILGVVGGVGDVSYGLMGFGIVSSLGLVDAQHGSSSGSGGGSDWDGKPTQGSHLSGGYQKCKNSVLGVGISHRIPSGVILQSFAASKIPDNGPASRTHSPEQTTCSSTSNETKSPTSNDSLISHASKTPNEGMQVILPHRDVSETKPKAPGTRAMEDMPSVFTKGNGPNGVKVDGILYKYGKGEEVSIMCVCHGKFLSPAEFVKHAGGGDVANPRRHIFIGTSTVFSQ